MATIRPHTITLKTGEDITLRHCAPSDAEQLPAFLKTIAKETNHTLQFPEKETSIDAARTRWEEAEKDPHFVFLGAFHKSQLCGQVIFHRENNEHPWIRDNAQFAMFVLKKYWGTGLAPALMETTIDTLSSWGIRRLEAKVRCDNKRGLAFYKKFGFEVEGTRKNCAQIHGELKSEYYIARLF